MTWKRPAGALLLSVFGMAISARVPEAGALFRWVFVVCALGGAWASWKISHAVGLHLRHVIGLAIICRILLFPLLPTLSDDGFRYIWDGMLLSQFGTSPYALIPSDPALVEQHAESIYSALNSPDYLSVYPPASQAVFAAGGLVYELGWVASWYGIKLIFVLLEGVGIACLSRVFAARGVALYALHPVALIEIAGQGHTEGALVCALGLTLVLIARRPAWAGFALAIAGWVKLFPLALAPLLGQRRRGWGGWLAGALVGALFLIPGNGMIHILDSVALYGGSLDFYSAPFLILKTVLYPVAVDQAGRWAALLLSLSWGFGLVGILVTRDGTTQSFQRGLALCIMGYVLLSPMQHPWNWLGLMLLLPLLPLHTSGMYWISSISLITYLRYVGVEHAYMAALALGWGGGLGIALFTSWQRRQAEESIDSTSLTETVSASSQT